MLNNVLRNLLSKPATRLFPQRRREPAANVRGTITFDTTDCVYCGACALRCPAKAIEVSRPDKTVAFNLFKCVICGSCVEACKKGCVTMPATYRAPSYEKPGFQFQGAPELPRDEAAEEREPEREPAVARG